jgi:hypothetical protein
MKMDKLDGSLRKNPQRRKRKAPKSIEKLHYNAPQYNKRG